MEVSLHQHIIGRFSQSVVPVFMHPFSGDRQIFFHQQCWTKKFGFERNEGPSCLEGVQSASPKLLVSFHHMKWLHQWHHLMHIDACPHQPHTKGRNPNNYPTQSLSRKSWWLSWWFGVSIGTQVMNLFGGGSTKASRLTNFVIKRDVLQLVLGNLLCYGSSVFWEITNIQWIFGR